jgi:hypothetical protein
MGRKLAALTAAGEKTPIRRLSLQEKTELDKFFRRPERLGDLIQEYGWYSTVDQSTRILSLRPDLVVFYNGDSNGDPVDADNLWRSYAVHDASSYSPRCLVGESAVTFAHELMHIVQALGASSMPRGVRHLGNNYSLYQTVMVEGVAVVSQQLMTDFLRHNRKGLGLHPTDVKLAALQNLERELAGLKRFLFTTFTQEFFYDNTSKQEASKRLAFLTGNEADWDEDKFGIETLVETEYFGTYVRGKDIAQSILDRVPDALTKLYKGGLSLVQSEQMARAIKGDVIFGMGLGSFGPHTMGPFILKHYLPRLVREYEGTRFKVPEPLDEVQRSGTV